MASQSTLDLTGFKLTFDDEFNAFSSNGPSNPSDRSHSGTWDTTLSYGKRKLNDEVEMYADPTVGLNPFSVSNGCLDIHAAPSRNLSQIRGRTLHLRRYYDQPLVLAALWLLRDACGAASMDRVEQELDPIDVWVNVARAIVFAPVSKLTPAEIRRGTEITYLGQVHGMMAVLKRLRPRNQVSIVNVGSALAYRSVPLQSIYCGTKFAIRGFTDPCGPNRSMTSAR